MRLIANSISRSHLFVSGTGRVWQVAQRSVQERLAMVRIRHGNSVITQLKQVNANFV